MKLIVRNLARTTTEDTLRDLFAAHGSVQSCSLVMDQRTGGSKGFGFVEMPRQGRGQGGYEKPQRPGD